MSSSSPSPLIAPPSDRDRIARIMVMTMHGLFLLSVLVPVLPLIVGVGLAYGTRAEAPEVWRSHFDDGIRTFWVYVILMLIAWPLWFVLFIGVVPMVLAYLLLAFRAARGFLRAAKWQAVA